MNNKNPISREELGIALEINNLRSEFNEKLEELQKRMEAKINKSAKVRFNPEKGDEYFTPTARGARQCTWDNDGFDSYYFLMGLAFETEQESLNYIARQKAIIQINDWIDEENDGWVADWGDKTQQKVSIFLSHENSDKGLDWITKTWSECPCFLNYIKSSQSAKKIISKITPEQIALIWGV